MNPGKKYILILILIAALGFLMQCHSPMQLDEYYCTLFSGEVSQNSVIVEARLQKTDSLVMNDVPGIEGYVKFRITADPGKDSCMESPFYHVSEENDFIARFEFTKLDPGLRYFYQACYGRDSGNFTTGPWNSFRTLSTAESNKNVSFAVVTGMNYQGFRTGNIQDGISPADENEILKGFPAFHNIALCKPDFWIGNGDNVYYDKPQQSSAIDRESMRLHWHRLFSMKDFTSMLATVPSYWMIDDHDFRFNDCDTLEYDENGEKLIPSAALGKEVFYEQLPLTANNIPLKSSCRTYRLNHDVQIWMLEGRFFRSPNGMADNKDKSIWGKEQLNWLKNTLLESTAPFKLIISPTPLIGPDDADKRDNHTNFGGFRTERDSLFFWLKENGFRNHGLYFICGDRHWQYHSIDPTGFEEFSCGAIVDANARPGVVPGDSLSTDPEGKIVQPYCQKSASGGFLIVESSRDEYNFPFLLFKFFDDQKTLLYAVKKY
ncbi:MAG: alkaline phosphatase D family protein [Bacteroidales bacterium]|nr:alkaline phosphatase D family protein [Bacteroidales bacterium]MCB9012637.1 alkaline phosphatase D family protein [Bacteroidales bacterium]